VLGEGKPIRKSIILQKGNKSRNYAKLSTAGQIFIREIGGMGQDDVRSKGTQQGKSLRQNELGGNMGSKGKSKKKRGKRTTPPQRNSGEKAESPTLARWG